MNNNSTPSTSPLLTRRAALGLALAGATLPMTQSLAATGGNIPVYVHVINRPREVVLTPWPGESFPAQFESELLIGSNGTARGAMSYTLLHGEDIPVRMVYDVERGGLDLDDAGNPIRVWVLSRLRRSAGRLAQDFALTSVAPAPLLPEDCLIYTTVGSCVHVEPVRFELPGRWEVRRSPVR